VSDTEGTTHDAHTATKPRPASAGEALHLGVDIGSVSVDLALVDGERRVIETQYLRHKGQPVRTAHDALREMVERVGAERIASVSATGSGGRLAAELLGGATVNEVVAQARAAAELHPEVRTVIEIGGEDSKLTFLNADGSIADFAMNTMCAAGTGSFLYQRAWRLRMSIAFPTRLVLL